MSNGVGFRPLLTDETAGSDAGLMTVSADCLVVDDEQGVGWALSYLLRSAGYGVEVASTAAAALESIRCKRFGVIFLDVKLPDADGFEVAREIRQAWKDLPIVMVSAYFYADDPRVRHILAQGYVSWFVPKPFEHREILSLLRKLTVNP